MRKKVEFLNLFLFLFLFLNLFLNQNNVLGAVVTTQATVGTPSAYPTDEMVQEIREVVQEKVKEKIQEIKEKIEKKGYVGVLKEITNSTLTLETITGEKMVQIASQAAIIGENRREIKAKDLEIDQKLICMGILDENKILQAKRIVVVPTPTKNPPKREAILGRLEKIDLKEKTITITNLKRANKQTLIKIDKNTNFLVGKFEDMKINDIILVITTKEKETDIPTAILLKVILLKSD